MNDLKNNKPHFVLPEVYGDSLSYYEVLANLKKCIQKLTNFVNAKFDNIFENAMNEYVSTLFENATYDEETHTLILDIDFVQKDNYHLYNETDKTMYILTHSEEK